MSCRIGQNSYNSYSLTIRGLWEMGVGTLLHLHHIESNLSFCMPTRDAQRRTAGAAVQWFPSLVFLVLYSISCLDSAR